MILVDTSVWIDHLRGRAPTGRFDINREIEAGNVIVGDLIMVEVLQGVRAAAEIAQVTTAFRLLRTVSLCSPDLAPRAAQYCRRLRLKGITVRSTIDVVIATWCIENEVTLAHNDRDFDQIAQHLPLAMIR